MFLQQSLVHDATIQFSYHVLYIGQLISFIVYLSLLTSYDASIQSAIFSESFLPVFASQSILSEIGWEDGNGSCQFLHSTCHPQIQTSYANKHLDTLDMRPRRTPSDLQILAAVLSDLIELYNHVAYQAILLSFRLRIVAAVVPCRLDISLSRDGRDNIDQR